MNPNSEISEYFFKELVGQIKIFQGLPSHTRLNTDIMSVHQHCLLKLQTGSDKVKKNVSEYIDKNADTYMCQVKLWQLMLHMYPSRRASQTLYLHCSDGQRVLHLL
jgi:hypothetical protein